MSFAVLEFLNDEVNIKHEDEALVVTWSLCERSLSFFRVALFRIATLESSPWVLMLRVLYPGLSSTIAALFYLYFLFSRDHAPEVLYTFGFYLLRRCTRAAMIFDLFWTGLPVFISLMTTLIYHFVFRPLLIYVLFQPQGGWISTYIPFFTFWWAIKRKVWGTRAQAIEVSNFPNHPNIDALKSNSILSLFSRHRWLQSLFLIQSWKRRRNKRYQLFAHHIKPTVEELARLHPEYKYQKLKVGHIRLLKLCRGLQDSTPICFLIDIPLNEAIEGSYEAVSYVWGGEERTTSIFVDDRHLRVTTSVYHAISALAPSNGSRLVWIDFLCINQEDDTEKSEQVRMMRDIYSNATQVLALLNPGIESATEFDGCEIAKEHVEKLAARARKGRINFITFVSESTKHKFGKIPVEWEEVEKLVCLPYWERV